MNHDDWSPPEENEHLHELAKNIPHGPWTYRRSHDGSLLVYCGDEPLAHIYGGIDVAKWIVEVSPARLLGGHR